MRQTQRVATLWRDLRCGPSFYQHPCVCHHPDLFRLGCFASRCPTSHGALHTSFNPHIATPTAFLCQTARKGRSRLGTPFNLPRNAAQGWSRWLSLSTGDNDTTETDVPCPADDLQTSSEPSDNADASTEVSEKETEETTNAAESASDMHSSIEEQPVVQEEEKPEEEGVEEEGVEEEGVEEEEKPEEEGVEEENINEPIMELNTTQEESMEDDDVFDPASLRPQKDDFIKFSDFVKWPQFKEALDGLGDKVRFSHVASAFTSLRNIFPRPPETFLDSLARKGIPLLSEARSNQLARLFYSCGKLRYIHRDFMEKMSQRILQERLVMQMDGCDISIMLYSIGILSRFQLLVFAAEKGMRLVDLFQLYIQETPPILFPSQPELVTALCEQIAVTNRLSGFKEQELANIVYGCGLLRAPEPAALQALAREIANYQRLTKFTGQEISNIIYGFGLNQVKDEGMLYTLSDYLLKTGRLLEMETQHLANILYGFSRVEFAYPPILDALMKEIVQSERLRRFKVQELANIISCAALIGIQDESFYRTLGKEAVQSHRLKKYMEHNFSTIVLGMATVSVRDADVLRKLASEMRRPERLPNYTSKDICDIIWAFNNLEFLDDGFMLSLVAELRKPQRIRQCDARVWQSCRAHVFSWSLAFPF